MIQGKSGVLSIREISRRTGVPESTLRYYRNLFSDYIPTVGSGRGRRHPEEAVEVFQRISRLFAAGESRGAVRRDLERATVTAGEATPGTNDRASASGAPVEVARGYEMAVAEPEGRLRRADLEHMLTAMMVRDRELVAMHRELLELLEKLLRALGSLAEAQAGWRVAWAEPAIPQAEPEPAAAHVARSPEAEEPDAADSLELERLRESLARERETVERLRRARMELEQRLARLEREEGRKRRRR